MHFVFICSVAAILTWTIGWPVFLALITRRDVKKFAALMELFDAGTAKIGRNKLIPGHYNRAHIFGLFHGRPASISTQHGLTSQIQFCVSGQFRMPFEVKAKNPPKVGEIRKGLKRLLEGSPLPLYIIIFLDRVNPEISFWKVCAAVLLFFITVRFLIVCYAKWIGYDEAPPKDSSWEVSVPGSAPLLYSTYSPTRFRTMVERPEIQDPVAHLFGTCQIDLLSSPGQRDHFRTFEGWNGSVEAGCFYRTKLLQKDIVREVLTGLSTLCVNVAQIKLSSELLETARTPRNDISTARS